MLEALGPLTPGRLVALELVAADLVLEERLHRMTDINLAFAGGDAARNHADDLRGKRREIANILHPVADDPEERRAQTVEQVRAAAAMFGRSL